MPGEIGEDPVKLAPQHRTAWSSPPVFASTRILAALLLLSVTFGGCATSHHRRPRALGFAGAAAAVVGSGIWVVGEQRDQPGAIPAVGLGVVAAGIIAMVAAGGWIAAQVACQADPDCDDSEECREIPAPPGGVPYKQCMAR